tara:strand:- start:3387 stop:6134 length:2748 start_codon:yes stop_codon:yes gene_type:complete
MTTNPSNDNKNTLIDNFIELCRSYLQNNGDTSEDRISEAVYSINQLPFFNGKLTTLDLDEIELKIQEIEGIDMDFGIGLDGDDDKFEEWLDSKRKEKLKRGYWEIYKRLLSKKLSQNVVTKINMDGDLIISKCGDPLNNNKWERKGLVIGDVQSGKTANYIGLITKAADLGYKVIVVIAGRDNNLRRQTQQRIDDGFINPISDSIQEVPRPFSVTNLEFDFDTPALQRIAFKLEKNLNPVVAVIKKNTYVLNNLKKYFRNSRIYKNGKIDLPFILIDDEADNASINTKYGSIDDDPTRINSDIREILNIFSKSSYVGYTATPFANIFIDPDSNNEMFGSDLFPKHFILKLAPPTNYVGPKRIFIDEDPHDSSIIKNILDNEDYIPLKHKKSHQPYIPKSLKEALISFYLVNAIFEIRGIFYKKDISMMINVTLFTQVQELLKLSIIRYKEELDNLLNHNLNLEDQYSNERLKVFKDVYEKHFSDINENWDEVKNAIKKTYYRIEVKSINQESCDLIEYKSGDKNIEAKSYIVIGGHSLSRGFTLEGLVISYLLRNTRMCDTLLQMGRWFGYRDGYQDLCKIWMTPDAIDWYQFIAEEIEYLNSQIRDMARLKKSPMDFGLQVRENPLSLLITAANKMGASDTHTYSVTLSSRLIETTALPSNKDQLKENFNISRNLIQNLSRNNLSEIKKHNGISGILFNNIALDIIEDYISDFISRSPLTNPITPITKYIKDRIDEFNNWDVFVVCPQKQTRYPIRKLEIGNLLIPTSARKLINEEEDKIKFSQGKVSGRGIEKVGLTEEEVEGAIANWQNENIEKIKNGDCKKDGYPDSIFRIKGRKPLLVIYLLDLFKDKESNRDLDDLEDFAYTTWSISFPPTNYNEEKADYIVNKVWIQQNFFNILNPEEEDELRGSDGN